MGKVYYDQDGHIEAIQDKVIAIIGYGNQGRSQALNMRDSGAKHIIVGSIHDESWNTANADGFPTYSIAEASKKADIVFLLLPDEVAPEIYERDIAPNLHPGAALNFASGYNITYGFIKPAADLDVIMVAPRMIGKGVRETYENGTGFPTTPVKIRKSPSSSSIIKSFQPSLSWSLWRNINRSVLISPTLIFSSEK